MKGPTRASELVGGDLPKTVDMGVFEKFIVLVFPARNRLGKFGGGQWKLRRAWTPAEAARSSQGRAHSRSVLLGKRKVRDYGYISKDEYRELCSLLPQISPVARATGPFRFTSEIANKKRSWRPLFFSPRVTECVSRARPCSSGCRSTCTKSSLLPAPTPISSALSSRSTSFPTASAKGRSPPCRPVASRTSRSRFGSSSSGSCMLLLSGGN